MDYELVYDDSRNAVAARPSSSWRPLPRTTSPRTVVVPHGSRPAVITGNATGYYQQAPQYSQSPYSQYPQYFAPPFFPPQTPFASRFGMTTGEMIDTGIQLLAAIVPLPAAPVSQGEVGTDVENLQTYQTALAVYAKRDEQLRTLGTLLTRILR